MSLIQNYSKFRFKPFRKRIGDIVVANYFEDVNGKKTSLQSHLKLPKYSFFEIIKNQPNPYYNKKEEYEQNKTSLFSHMDDSCFINPETGYMLAHWINVNSDELMPDLQLVGNRLFELEWEEQLIFLSLADEAQKFIQKELERLNKKHNEI